MIGGFISLLGILLVNSFGTFVEELPGIEEKLYQYYLGILDGLANLGLAIDTGWLSGLFDADRFGDWIPALLGQVGNLMMQSVVVALLVMFLLFETLNFRDKLSRALANPAPSLRRFQEFSMTLKRYLAVKTLVSLATGALIWVACQLVGVEFPLLWAVLAFALNYIPNIGSAIAAVPPVLLLLVSPDGGLVKALILSGAYLGVNFVLGNIIEPRVMGRALGLSTFVAFLSLVVWGWVFGVVGMLLSVVLTMTSRSPWTVIRRRAGSPTCWGRARHLSRRPTSRPPDVMIMMTRAKQGKRRALERHMQRTRPRAGPGRVVSLS